MRELPFEALADQRNLVCVSEGGVERRLDVTVGNAASAQLAGDAKTSLAAQLRMVAREVERVTRIVKISLFAKPRDHDRNQVFVVGSALEILLHLVNRMRAAHQRAQRGSVEVLLGGKFARRRTHNPDLTTDEHR